MAKTKEVKEGECEMKYTKGRWKVKNNEIILSGSGARIAQMNVGWPDNEIKANANLISAAPKMYKALKLLLDGSELDPKNPKRTWTRQTPSSEAIIAGFKALAKAEGK